MPQTVAQCPLRNDPRTATAAAGESISLPEEHKKVLLEELGPGELVRSFYNDGWGYAVLTVNGLILLRNLWAPRATRVCGPLWILRSAYGVSDSVDVLVEGKPHKLHGSKIDPKGDLLTAAGSLLPPGSPLRPSGGTLFATWIRRHPVLATTGVVTALVAGLNPGTEADPGSDGQETTVQLRTDRALTVPDFEGTTLAEAVAKTRTHGWLRVSTLDASSAHRTVEASRSGWRVCFQEPSGHETVRPSANTLKLYAVPEREECPAQLYGSRRVLMPDLVGERFDDASRALGDAGLADALRFHAHTGKVLDDEPGDLADWEVCRQQPEPDTEVNDGTRPSLWLIGSDASCAKPSPEPKPKPKPAPKPKPVPKPRPQPSYGTASGGTSGSGSAGSSTGGGTTSGGTTGGGTTGGGTTGGGTTGGGTGSQGGVGFGQFCSPVGATATTSDGRPAKCFMGKDGRARWGYNSG